MSHLDRVPKEQSLALEPDADGFIGRQCPVESCRIYFKITPGTGLANHSDCRCPTCGHEEHTSHFTTDAQREYAISVMTNQVMGAVLKEFDYRPKRGTFGIGLSMKVQGKAPPVKHYQELELETIVECDDCALRYAIYGVFGYCPDCGEHNSLGILSANLRLVDKMLDLAQGADKDLAARLEANALQDCVSAFDAWGRTVTERFKGKAVRPAHAPVVKFQNLEKSQRQLLHHFGFDMEATLGTAQFAQLFRAFQKRHLLAHQLGVVDAAYLDATKDPDAVEGRQVPLSVDEVRIVRVMLPRLAEAMVLHFEGLP